MKFNFKLNLKVTAFYLEKQKSFIPKKRFRPLSISEQKALFTDSIFQKVLGKACTKISHPKTYELSYSTTAQSIRVIGK